MNISKIIRFLFILVIYNLIICLIAFATKYTLRALNVDFSIWGAIDWWLLISVYIFIAIFMLYLAPFFEEWLNQKLENILKSLKRKPKIQQITTLKEKIQPETLVIMKESDTKFD
ncbi:MAG: hypothetical protein ACTSQJ_00220 [Promethearchaeota archaeon]